MGFASTTRSIRHESEWLRDRSKFSNRIPGLLASSAMFGLSFLAFVCLLCAALTRASPCQTVQSCVDSAAISDTTLSVILPLVLETSPHNCNVSIDSNALFNRAILSGVGPSSTVIDCTSSGILSPFFFRTPTSLHTLCNNFLFIFYRNALFDYPECFPRAAQHCICGRRSCCTGDDGLHPLVPFPD